MKSNANKSGFFNGINDFFKQESEIGRFKQFCFKSVNLSKVERNSEKKTKIIKSCHSEYHVENSQMCK